MISWIGVGGSTNILVDEKIEVSLVGKIQTSRANNFGAMNSTMNQIWSLSKREIFRETENYMLIIQFFH